MPSRRAVPRLDTYPKHTLEIFLVLIGVLPSPRLHMLVEHSHKYMPSYVLESPNSSVFKARLKKLNLTSVLKIRDLYVL